MEANQLWKTTLGTRSDHGIVHELVEPYVVESGEENKCVRRKTVTKDTQMGKTEKYVTYCKTKTIANVTAHIKAYVEETTAEMKTCINVSKGNQAFIVKKWKLEKQVCW